MDPIAVNTTALPDLLRQVRCVLFDAVGTLLFPDPPVAEVYRAVGQRYGSELSREQIGRRFRECFARFQSETKSDELRERERWRSIVGAVFDDVRTGKQELFQELWDHFARPASWALYHDVSGVWRELERRGKRIGIASNFDSRLLTLCRAIPPLDRAAHVFCSSQVGYAKPRLEFFRSVQEQLGLAADEILLVGDDPEADFAGATRAGWHAVLLDPPGQWHDRPTIARLTQLIQGG